MSGSDNRSRVDSKAAVVLTLREWEAVINELRRGSDMALSYGNRKHAETLSNIRFDIMHQVDL
jgi:hypothetical protein